MALPCGHVFHQTCVSEWLTRHPFCPHCRINVLSLQPDDDGAAVSHHGGSGGANASGARRAPLAPSVVLSLSPPSSPPPHGRGRGSPPLGELCRVCAQAVDEMDVHQIVLECQHRFHHECIGASLLRAPACPWCRAPVSRAVEQHVNDRRDILAADPAVDVARLHNNRVRLQAYNVRLHKARYERMRRRGCSALAFLVLLALAAVIYLVTTGRL